jgi:hypothetical protein
VDFKLENVLVSLHSLKTMGLGSIIFFIFVFLIFGFTYFVDSFNSIYIYSGYSPRPTSDFTTIHDIPRKPSLPSLHAAMYFFVMLVGEQICPCLRTVDAQNVIVQDKYKIISL